MKKDIRIYQLDGREDKVVPSVTSAKYPLARLSVSITILQAFPGS